MAQAAYAGNGNETLYQTILSELSEVSDEWMQANKEGDFSKVADLIGYKHAFRFISETTGGEISFGTSVLSKTVKFAEGWLRDVSNGKDSSVQPEQIRNILNEVTSDSSNYVSGNAVSHLDAIVSADFSLKNASDRAKYTSRQDISEGFLRFKNTPPLSSWEDLKYWAAFSSSVKGLFLISTPNGRHATDIKEAARFEIAGGPQLSADVELFTIFQIVVRNYRYYRPDFYTTMNVLLVLVQRESHIRPSRN
jgi:hypothetical protein